MYIRARERRIIENLIQQEEGITIKELAEKIGVSERTIHRDLAEVENTLHKYDLTLIKQSGIGIRISGDIDKIGMLELMLNQTDAVDLTPDERRILLLSILLESNEPVKLSTLASELEITAATVSNDLNQVEEWMKDFNLELIRRRGYGIEIAGSETDIRRAISSLFTEYFEEGKLIEILKESVVKKQESINIDTLSARLLGLVSKEKLLIVEKVVEEIQEQLPYKMADSAYIGLIVHLSLALVRIEHGEKIEFDQKQLESLETTAEYRYAEKLAERLEEAFHLSIPDTEKGYITMHLKGAKVRSANENWLNEYNAGLNQQVANLIKFVEKELQVDLIDDYSLFEGLAAHLERALYRLRQGMKIYNPLLDQVKNDYAAIFDAVSKGMEKVFKSYDVPESEIGYLVMHFGSVMQTKNLRKNFKALVICSSGIGSSKMLVSRLEKEVPEITEMKNQSAFGIEKVDLHDYDVILSTIPLAALDDSEYILVSPFLSDKEIQKIRIMLSRKENRPLDREVFIQSDDNADRQNVLSGYASIKRYITQAVDLLSRFGLYHLSDFENKEDVLRQACSLLESQGILSQTEQVVKKLLERERLGALGIPGSTMALYHARSEHVHEPIFIIFSLGKPITIPSMEQEPLKVTTILLMLAPMDVEEEAQELLSLISSLIIQEDRNKTIFQSNQEAMIFSLINKSFHQKLQEKLEKL